MSIGDSGTKDKVSRGQHNEHIKLKLQKPVSLLACGLAYYYTHLEQIYNAEKNQQSIT